MRGRQRGRSAAIGQQLHRGPGVAERGLTAGPVGGLFGGLDGPKRQARSSRCHLRGVISTTATTTRIATAPAPISFVFLLMRSP